MPRSAAHNASRTLDRIASREGHVQSRTLVDIDLSGADLRGARFESTVLIRCNLAGADLRGARFTLCELYGVVLTDAVFGDNRFDGTMFVDVIGVAEPRRALIQQDGGTFQPPRASDR